MSRTIKFTAVCLAVCLSPLAAAAGPQASEVQFEFSENGVATAYSAIYSPNSDIAFMEVFGGYTLLISADTDNAYGQTVAGANPFLSFSIQVSPVGGQPPPPITIGLSMTGLTSSPGTNYDLDSTATTIFHASSTAAFNTYYDATDALFGTGGPLSSFLLTKIANAQDQSLLAEIDSAYSLSAFITLNPANNAHPTLDGQLDLASVPEPASLGLVGVACVGLGVVGRSRRKRHTNSAG